MSTKERIICVARRLFWEKSYEGVSVDQICKEADVKKGSFYHFFPSKDALVVEILDGMLHSMEENLLKPCFDSSIPPMKRFQKYVKQMDGAITKMHKENGKMCGCPVGNIASEMGTQSEEIRSKITEIFDCQRGYFKQALDDAQSEGKVSKKMNTKTMAEVLISCAQGVAVLGKTRNEPKLFKTHFSAILQSIA